MKVWVRITLLAAVAALVACGPSARMLEIRSWWWQRVDSFGHAWFERHSRLTKAVALEATGLAAESRGDLQGALREYVAALGALPERPPPKVAVRILERAILAARRLQPPPSIHPDAERHALRASTFLKIAATESDYERVMAEFRKVIAVAPWWADAYFNLAVVAEKAGRPDVAMGSLRLYLLAKPDAEDAQAVKRKVVELEVKAGSSLASNVWRAFGARGTRSCDSTRAGGL
jgi:tetratricopeptide (TPR) repeat protein